MNKFFLAILGIASLSLMISCGNGEDDSSNANKQDETAIEQNEPKEEQPKEEQPEETETKETEETGSLNADSIKPGDEIEGLSVVSADHSPGRYFTVYFKGEIMLEGSLQQNPMEYTTEFYPANSPIQVKISNETYELFQSFAIENIELLEAELNNEQKSMYNNGQVIPLTITIADPVANLYFGSKGRRADGTCQFVKMQ